MAPGWECYIKPINRQQPSEGSGTRTDLGDDISREAPHRRAHGDAGTLGPAAVYWYDNRKSAWDRCSSYGGIDPVGQIAMKQIFFKEEW